MAIVYHVKYKLNPDYAGDFQVDKLTDQDDPSNEVIGIHGKFRNIKLAQEAKQKCKDWFNKESIPVKRANDEGKVISEIRTTIHDNVVVWIEQYKDGFQDTEFKECDEKKKPGKREVSMA